MRYLNKTLIKTVILTNNKPPHQFMKNPAIISYGGFEISREIQQRLIQVARFAVYHYKYNHDRALEPADYVSETILHILELQRKGYLLKNIEAAIYIISRRKIWALEKKARVRSTTSLDSVSEPWEAPSLPSDSEQLWRLIRLLVTKSQFEALEAVYRFGSCPKELAQIKGERVYTWLSRGRMKLAANSEMFKTVLGLN